MCYMLRGMALVMRVRMHQAVNVQKHHCCVICAALPVNHKVLAP
jgi:hypothetical protein